MVYLLMSFMYITLNNLKTLAFDLKWRLWPQDSTPSFMFIFLICKSKPINTFRFVLWRLFYRFDNLKMFCLAMQVTEKTLSFTKSLKSNLQPNILVGFYISFFSCSYNNCSQLPKHYISNRDIVFLLILQIFSVCLAGELFDVGKRLKYYGFIFVLCFTYEKEL